MSDEINKIENITSEIDETADKLSGAAEKALEGAEKKVEEAEAAAINKEKKIVDDILEIIESTLLTVFVIVMVFTYLLHPVNVVGTSMEDTLNENDRIFMSTVYTGPHYKDIIVINNDKAYLLDDNGKIVERDIADSQFKECIIKRVIAEPGQTIELNAETHEVIVDGKVLNEPYIKDPIQNEGSFKYPFKVPEGYYFVMGDNRLVSADSRHSDIGLIKKDQIYGRAVVRYSPIKEFKLLFNK